jgi:hypothetical protein
VNPHGVFFSTLNCNTGEYGDFSIFKSYSPVAALTPILRFLQVSIGGIGGDDDPMRRGDRIGQAQVRAWLLNLLRAITLRQVTCL